MCVAVLGSGLPTDDGVGRFWYHNYYYNELHINSSVATSMVCSIHILEASYNLC